ncbi:MAG: hypothetical protein ACTSWE_13780, partial [Promethearchaeota archaeon]
MYPPLEEVTTRSEAAEHLVVSESAQGKGIKYSLETGTEEIMYLSLSCPSHLTQILDGFLMNGR